jgi:hypothetical protein
MTYEPRFDRDYAYGRQGELLVDGLLAALDRGDARVETKRKGIRDCVVYVELEQNAFGRGEWKPSGAAKTEAEAWVYVVADTDIMFVIPLARIRRALDLGLGTPSSCDSDNPTRGVLLNVGLLLSARCDP